MTDNYDDDFVLFKDSCSKPVESWVRNLRKDEDNPLYWDVLLRVGEDQCFKAHKNVLAASVNWFKVAFQPESNRLKDGEVKFSEVEVSDVGLQAILWFIYGETVELNAADVWQIYTSCNFLRMFDLSDKCVNFMCKSKDILRFWSYAIDSAIDFQPNALVMELNEVIAKHFARLSKTKKFVELKPQPFLSIVECTFLVVHEKNQILDGSLRWLNHDWANRYNYAKRLSDIIEWSRVDYTRARTLASVHELQDRECSENDQVKAAFSICRKLIAPPLERRVTEKLIYLIFKEKNCKKWYFKSYESETCHIREGKTYLQLCMCLKKECICRDDWSLNSMMTVERKPHIFVETKDHYGVCRVSAARCRLRMIFSKVSKTYGGDNGWLCTHNVNSSSFGIAKISDTIDDSSEEYTRTFDLPPDMKNDMFTRRSLQEQLQKGALADDSLIFELHDGSGDFLRLDLISNAWSRIQRFGIPTETWVTERFLYTDLIHPSDCSKKYRIYIGDRSLGRKANISSTGGKDVEPEYILPDYKEKAIGQHFWVLGDHLYAFEPHNGTCVVKRLNLTEMYEDWQTVFGEGIQSVPAHVIMI